MLSFYAKGESSPREKPREYSRRGGLSAAFDAPCRVEVEATGEARRFRLHV